MNYYEISRRFNQWCHMRTHKNRLSFRGFCCYRIHRWEWWLGRRSCSASGGVRSPSLCPHLDASGISSNVVKFTKLFHISNTLFFKNILCIWNAKGVDMQINYKDVGSKNISGSAPVIFICWYSNTVYLTFGDM